MLRLEWLRPDGSGGWHPLLVSPTQVTIGRGSECVVRLAHPTVTSPLHARVEEVAGARIIVDLGSTNGTFVVRGARRLRAPVALREGDVIHVGEHAVTVVEIPGSERAVEGTVTRPVDAAHSQVTLTNMQRQVIEAFATQADGTRRSRRDVARFLQRSEETIKVHLERMYEALGIAKGPKRIDRLLHEARLRGHL